MNVRLLTTSTDVPRTTGRDRDVRDKGFSLIRSSTVPAQRDLKPFAYEECEVNLDYHKFLIRRNLIPQFIIDFLYTWYNNNFDKFKIEDEKGLVDNAYIMDSFYFKELFWLFDVLTPRVESITKSKLIPVYSYGRVYRPKSQMEPHIDRAQCDVSMTITIAHDGRPWPIHAMPPFCNNPISIELSPGDALIYRGGELPHWRRLNNCNRVQYQHFFHWIDTSTECGSFMSEFSEQEIKNSRLWPEAFSVLKSRGNLPLPRREDV